MFRYALYGFFSLHIHDEITDNVAFVYFKNKFLTCSLCTPEGEKGTDVVSKVFIGGLSTNFQGSKSRPIIGAGRLSGGRHSAFTY